MTLALVAPGRSVNTEAAPARGTQLSNVTEDDGQRKGAQRTREREILKVSDMWIDVLLEGLRGRTIAPDLPLHIKDGVGWWGTVIEI